MTNGSWIALTAVGSLVLAVVLAIAIAGLTFRYDLTTRPSKRTLRWRAFYEPGYWTAYMHDHPESGFRFLGSNAVGAAATRSSTARANPDGACVVVYSLYGNHPKYFDYMQSNVDMVRTRLPGWRTRIYIHDQAPIIWRETLAGMDVDLVVVADEHVRPGNSAGAFWRFVPLCEDNTDCVILDADDPLTPRLVGQILDFFAHPGAPLVRTKSAYPWPVNHMLAGVLFKKRAFSLPFGTEQLRNYPHRSRYGSDEIFLTTEVAPHAARQGVDRLFRLQDLFVRCGVSLPTVTPPKM